MNGYSLGTLRKILLICALLAVGSRQLFAFKVIELKWSALPPVITGHNVELVLKTGNVLKGKVLEVLPSALVLNVTKSSAETDFPIGKNEISRNEFDIIKLISSNAVKGAVIGGLVGIPLGIGNGKLQGTGAGLGTGVVCVSIGGLIGWARNKSTTIKILPD